MSVTLSNEKVIEMDDDTTDIRKAVDRIFAIYGNDLSAFFRDAYKEVERNRNQKQKKPLDVGTASNLSSEYY